ncbi:MAG: YqhG family protein [Candidatus Carbobacillus sp.]|nr:YqhG family protein [Candidatus Carbobacillus sp.]
MNQTSLYTLARAYFELSGSNILEDEPPYRLTIELSEEADQALGYRPFYWSYITHMRMKPELLKKTYRFLDVMEKDWPLSSTNDVQNRLSIAPLPGFHQQEEWISWGSPRLYRMFEAMMNHGRYTCLYAQNPAVGRLTPYLFVSYTISQLAHHRKESIKSYLVRLTDLYLEPIDAQDLFSKKHLSPHPPHYTSLLPRMFHPKSALQRSHEAVRKMIEEQFQDWVKEAEAKLEQERMRLDAYYQALSTHLDKKSHTFSPVSPRSKQKTVTPQEAQQALEERLKAIQQDYVMRDMEIKALYTPQLIVELEQVALLYLE